MTIIQPAALAAGATHLVVARPILEATSPVMAAARIAAEMLQPL
jgi:orotidine-5'-phosphate decarboxylase